MRLFTLAAILAVALLVLGASGVYLFYYQGTLANQTGCHSYSDGGNPIRSQLTATTTGAMIQYLLPEPARSPNSLAMAPDGSVWFGEVSVPALAHLFTNGTLLEYVWPGEYPPAGALNYTCGFRTQIWGIALWNGTVWASDSAGNQLVSLNPETGSFHYLRMQVADAFPYAVVAGLDGRLWFTELFASSIGRLEPNGTLHEYSLPTGIRGTPTQIFFLNSSYAMYSDAGQAGEGNGGVFSFSPSNPVFNRIGGNKSLNGITGLSPTVSGVWISEHGPPFLEYFDYSSATWTKYPTSLVTYSGTTLPYFITTDGTRIWFNEHYGDKIAEVDPAHQSMVEYSIGSPPASNFSSISDSQTIAREGAKIWFAEFNKNRIGFADFASPPSFMLSTVSSQISLRPGMSIVIPFKIQGHSQAPIELRFSDSESQTGVPSNLTVSPSAGPVVRLNGYSTLNVTLSAAPGLKAGAYIFDVTATDGIIGYTEFLLVDIA